MRVFFEAKLVDRGPQIPIQPVSFGLVAEDGRECYVINEECLTNVLRDPWSAVTIRPSLPVVDDQHTSSGFITSWDANHPEYENVLSLEHLTTVIRDFFMTSDDDAGVELWSYYGSFGHVALCQLFGARREVPSAIPMSFYELVNVMNDDPELAATVPAPEQGNHALRDARWYRDIYTVLSGAQLPETGIQRLTM